MKPAKLAHVVLRTRDVERLANWYSAAFDARRTVDQSPMLVFISFDEEHHRLGFVRMEHEASGDARNAPGLAHAAFTYASAKNLLKQYAELKAAGIRPAFTIHHGATLSAYYRDPDGNVVEMFADVFETTQAADAFMRSPAFMKNPIGKPVDFDLLLEQMEQGASERTLLAYPDAEIDPWAFAKSMNDALEGRANVQQ